MRELLAFQPEACAANILNGSCVQVELTKAPPVAVASRPLLGHPSATSPSRRRARLPLTRLNPCHFGAVRRLVSKRLAISVPPPLSPRLCSSWHSPFEQRAKVNGGLAVEATPFTIVYVPNWNCRNGTGGHLMRLRRFMVLAGALCFLSTGAAAQGPAGVGAGGRSASAPSGDFGLTQWQVAIGYQYNRNQSEREPAFNTNGLNVSLARYFGNWFGLEAQVGAGFGNTGTDDDAPAKPGRLKSVFAGGGPRLAYRGHGRLEPWIHGTVGVEYFRFTQTTGLYGSNAALAWSGGGGVDLHLNPHVAVRVGADELWTRFFSGRSEEFPGAVGGLVFDF